MSTSFICINVEGVDLKNTVLLQLVQWPIILIGLSFRIQRGPYKEYVVQFKEKNPSVTAAKFP